jgi:flagellar biosynthetic protein FlhB
MSEEADESSKTEEPSGRKLGKAHDEGQFAISREINTWASVLGGLIIVGWFVPMIINMLRKRLVFFLSQFDQIPTDQAGIGNVLELVLIDAISAIALPLLLMMVFGVAASAIQVGGVHIRWTLIKFDLAKLNPLAGLQRMFSPIKQSIELGKNIAKVIAVGTAAFFVIKPMFLKIETFTGIEMIPMLGEMHRIAFRLFMVVLLMVTIIAGADWFYQTFSFHKQMKMTKQEVKDEYKQTEGDPLIKGRLRGMRMEKARKRMMAAVPRADVVVTNPTHYAVAMQYDPKAGGAPVVLAKGVDQLAHNIRKIAEEHKIPIVRNPPLARALHDTVELDEEIPAEHYRAVAEIITYVFKLKGKSLGG